MKLKDPGRQESDCQISWKQEKREKLHPDPIQALTRERLAALGASSADGDPNSCVRSRLLHRGPSLEGPTREKLVLRQSKMFNMHAWRNNNNKKGPRVASSTFVRAAQRRSVTASLT